MNNIVTVNIGAITEFVKKGKDFVFKKEAEEQLIKLLQLRDLIDEHIEMVKKGIEVAGKSIDPSFKGVIGDKVKAIYRVYGEKYTYDKALVDKLEGFLKSFTYHKVDSKAVDAFFEKKGTLPIGIFPKYRQPIISLVMDKDNEPLQILPENNE